MKSLTRTVDPPPLTQDDLAAVPRANDVYSGLRLIYDKGFEQQFIDTRTGVNLLAAGSLGFTVGALFTTIAAFVISNVEFFPDRTDQYRSVATLVIMGEAFVLGFLLMSFKRRARGVSSWQVVLRGRGQSTTRAIDDLVNELRSRGGGAGMRIGNVRVDDGHTMVRVTLGTYHAYVSIFPFGTDLFVGWALMEEVNFWQVLGGFVGDLFGRSSWFVRERRAYRVKAMRDLVHDATRRAVARQVAAATPDSQPGMPMPPPTTAHPEPTRL